MGKKKKNNKPSPSNAEPLDFGRIMAQANAGGGQSFKDQLAAQIEAYPKLEELQLGTANKFAANLNNEAYQNALGQIGSALGSRDDLYAQGKNLSGLGGLIGNFALQNYLTSGPTLAERNIQSLGQSAMGVRPDQVVAPTNMRNVNAVNAEAARMGPIRDVQGMLARRGQDVVSRDIAAARMGAVPNVNAVNARRVADIQSGQVGAGGLGSALMSQAMSRAANAGQLSSEASRDAIQAARQGMAARGMATGNAGLAAELLNRDRYSRARASEDLAFAQGVQQQDIGRQFQNVANQMTAAQANQSLAGQMSLADQAAAMDAQRLNQSAGLSVGQTNAQLAQQASLSNQDAALRASLANQQSFNQLSLADQAALMDAQRLNQATALSRGTTQAQLDQARFISNQDASMRAQLANQSRDQFLAAAGMDAQQANQTANMNQREMNRAFMLNANNAWNTGTMQRRDQAAQQAALGGNLMQNAGALYGNAANLGLAGAQSYLASDPYSRALGFSIPMSGAIQGNLSSTIGNSYSNALNAGLNVASFNANLVDTQANSQMNNWAAMQAARMQSGALGQQGMMGMFGGIGGGALMGVGLAL